MKKVFLKLACTIGALIAFASCQNALEQREFLMIETKNIQYAALTVSNDCGTSRSLDVSEIKFASIIVSGHDIEEADEPKLEYIPVTDGKNNGSITLERIPVGVDRIVTVKAFNKDKNELPNFQIRAVTDIKPGNENTVIVNKSTTAFGDVLYGIKSIYNFEELEKDGRMNTVRAVIDTEIHPSLYNSSKLIGDLQGFCFPDPNTAKKEDYHLSTGSITFNYLLAQNFNVSINDPISEALTNQSAGNEIKIDNIVPGNWLLTVTDSDGNVLDKNEIQIEGKKITELGHLEHDGIAILMQQGKKSGGKEYNHIHYWDLVYDENIPESQKLEKTSWPGIAITTKITARNFSPENYYLYDFAKVKSVKLLITNGNGTKYCNDDMIASQKGVYCVHSTGLVPLTETSEPDAPIDNLKITGEHLKKCFIDDPENKRFVVLFDENLYGAKPQSVKAEFNKGINDHNGEYKGSHYSMTQHSKGFWYCSVPYEDVQATNQCGQPSYNFKVDGNIINPPSYVPDGYIYQKFNASNAGKAFLCLIYNSQDENEICSRLLQAKKCKELKDFDLTTEEGQQQISNFRLVPGTTTLFRSFHPYNDDDKKSISDTSKKRMEYVRKLSEKAGIKADINLSDTSQKNVTHGTMPEYYQKIIDNNAVLYMTDCSYGQCYETPDSEQFGKGIAKIVRFINKTEGPYQIHCAIGTDRTGVVCAVLSGLCGADINQITEDYCKSIEMGIYEYRGPGAVRYSLQKILGVQFLEDIPDLKQGLTDYFVKNKYLSKPEIEKMQEKLQQK